MYNICKKCKLGFLKLSLLEKHYADVHKISPTFTCNQCGYNSPSRKSANKHFNQCSKQVNENKQNEKEKNNGSMENNVDSSNYDYQNESMQNENFSEMHSDVQDEIKGKI